ncbi:MAG TPA: sigma-70 family RNA polymerase sigma factor [Candidatus Saccharimonadales bacterium]
MVRKYKSHKIVRRAILRQRKNTNINRKETDILGSYLNEAGSFNLLSESDEQELFGYIDRGVEVYGSLRSLDNISPQDREALIKLAAAHQVVYLSNLRLVISLSKKFWRKNNLSEMELVQEGNLGLDRAISRFDVSKGFKFSTYATWLARQAITRAIANQSRTIRIPISRHEQYRNAQKEINAMIDKLGRQLTDKEIEAATGMSMKKYAELEQDGRLHLPSLNALVSPGADLELELGSLVADPNADMNREVMNLSDREELTEILNNSSLTDREKFILGLYYGLGPELIGPLTINLGGKLLSYEEVTEKIYTDKGLARERIGELFKLSYERVRQIRISGMNKLMQAANERQGERL